MNVHILVELGLAMVLADLAARGEVADQVFDDRVHDRVGDHVRGVAQQPGEPTPALAGGEAVQRAGAEQQHAQGSAAVLQVAPAGAARLGHREVRGIRAAGPELAERRRAGDGGAGLVAELGVVTGGEAAAQQQHEREVSVGTGHRRRWSEDGTPPAAWSCRRCRSRR